LLQLFAGVAAMLGGLAFMLGHVLAAVLAAIHRHLVVGGLAFLGVLRMLRHRIGRNRSGWSLGGQSGRGNNRDHDYSPEFE